MKTDLTRRNPNQQRAQKTQAKLLETAYRILNEDGFSKLTTRNLAKAAGISTGVIYDYFPSKQALIYWIYEERLQERIRVFEDCLLGENLNKPIIETFPEYVLMQREFRLWSRLDLEFRIAEDSDPKFREMTEAFKDELTNRYVRFLKAHGTIWSEEKLRLLGRYSLGIDYASMRLQLDANIDEQKFFLSMTTRVSLFFMVETGVISFAEMDQIEAAIIRKLKTS